MRRRFFVERYTDGRAELSGERAHHLIHVLRAEPGQIVELTDGQAVWLARIARVRGQRVEFELLDPLESPEPAPGTRLLVGIIRFERFEWCLEKATELGVQEIQPLAAARSEAKLVAAAGKRRARWQKIVMAAAEQSRRRTVPAVLEPVVPGRAFAAAAAASERCWLLSERPDAPRLQCSMFDPPPRSVTLAVGPEGGWTESERLEALQAGFQEISLGPLIFRTETAALAAVALCQLLWAGTA
jgi:16S rRNA (uracil1498-N3)-methyltransferase